MIKKYDKFKKVFESGIRDIKKILNDFPSKEAEIYFHQDLDGVTSALAMKGYIKRYNFTVEEAHITQYGGTEFKQKETVKGRIPILVDFAHSKPMFTIATDHHDSQAGAEHTDATHFKSAPSNVETISGEISPSDIFTADDIKLINTVDSADYLRNNLKPEDVGKSIFNLDRDKTGTENRFIMGLVVNRLILAYKNKLISGMSLDGKREHIDKNILECLVLDSEPSLISMYNNLKHYITNFETQKWEGILRKFITTTLAKPEELQKNLDEYQDLMKGYDNLKVEDNIAVQKDAAGVSSTPIVDDEGNTKREATMFAPGSYDRYTVFKNYPDINFYSILWTMGLIQVSCNPFKEQELKGINLGEIKDIILDKHKEVLSKCYIDLYSVKLEAESDIEKERKKVIKSGKPFDNKYVGFKSTDVDAFYKDMVWTQTEGGISKTSIPTEIETLLDKPVSRLDVNEKAELKKFKIKLYDIIAGSSGGHACITNISGFSYMKYAHPKLKSYIAKSIGAQSNNYESVMSKIQQEFVDILKDRVNQSKLVENILTKFDLFMKTNEDLDVDGFAIKKGDKLLVGKEECVVMDTDKGNNKEMIVKCKKGKKVAIYDEKESKWDFK